jgi:hypothetical protein
MFRLPGRCRRPVWVAASAAALYSKRKKKRQRNGPLFSGASAHRFEPRTDFGGSNVRIII